MSKNSEFKLGHPRAPGSRVCVLERVADFNRANAALYEYLLVFVEKSAGEHAMLQGYIRYRKNYPGRKDVRFYWIPGGDFIARIARTQSK